jgi:hypothetical protein
MATQRAIAFHEAAHAVVAEAVGCPILRVCVVPGSAHFVASDQVPLSAINKAAILWAGGIAERRVSGMAEDGEDFAMISAVLGNDNRARWGSFRRSCRILTRRWPSVERLAALLELRGALTGHQVRDCLRAVASTLT